MCKVGSFSKLVRSRIIGTFDENEQKRLQKTNNTITQIYCNFTNMWTIFFFIIDSMELTKINDIIINY